MIKPNQVDMNREVLLNTLLKEYEIAQSNITNTNEKIVQLLGAGIGVFGLLSSYVFTQQATISLELVWLIPLVFVIFFALMLFVYFFTTSHQWIARVISRRINMLLGETALIEFESGAPASIFFSSRKGNIKPKIVYVALILGIAILFFIVLLVCFSRIYNFNHVAGTLFATIYGLIFVVYAYAFSGAFIDLPNIYRLYIDETSTLGKLPSKEDFIKIALKKISKSSFLLTLLPRPWDILVKGQIFWLGFVFSLIVSGLSESRLDLVNILFGDPKGWKSATEIPVIVVLGLGFIYFLIEEGLLQQAKLIWDDIRDKERDQILEQNKGRAIASGAIDTNSAIIQMTARWVLALILSYMLGNWVVLSIFLLITLHQAIYVLWAKQIAHKHPLVPLFVVSANVSFRFIAGAVIANPESLTTFPLVLMVIMFYFYSFGGMAAQWKMEAQYQVERKQSVDIRPQSQYFLKYGDFWQHVGLIAAILASVFTFFSIDVICQNRFVGLCNFISNKLFDFQKWGYIEESIVIVVATFLAAVFFALISKPILRGTKKMFVVIKPILVIISFGGWIYYLLVSLMYGQQHNYYLSITLMNLGFLVNYEFLTYPEYTMAFLKERIKVLPTVIYYYLFVPKYEISIKMVLGFLFNEKYLNQIKNAKKE